MISGVFVFFFSVFLFSPVDCPDPDPAVGAAAVAAGLTANPLLSQYELYTPTAAVMSPFGEPTVQRDEQHDVRKELATVARSTRHMHSFIQGDGHPSPEATRSSTLPLCQMQSWAHSRRSR